MRMCARAFLLRAAAAEERRTTGAGTEAQKGPAEKPAFGRLRQVGKDRDGEKEVRGSAGKRGCSQCRRGGAAPQRDQLQRIQNRLEIVDDILGILQTHVEQNGR